MHFKEGKGGRAGGLLHKKFPDMLCLLYLTFAPLALSDYSLLTPDDLDKMSRCYLEQIFCSQICHRRSKTCSSRPTHQNCNQLKDLSVIKGIFLWDKSLSLKSVHQYSEYTLRLSSGTPHCKKFLPRAPCPVGTQHRM